MLYPTTTWIAGLCVWFIPSLVLGADISYIKLIEGRARIPYGEDIRISGNLDEVVIDGNKLGEWIVVSSGEVTYYTPVFEQKKHAITFKGKDWYVMLDKLPAAAKVEMIFRFTGKLSDEKAGELIDKIMNDSRFKEASKQFIKSMDAAGGKVDRTMMNMFKQWISPVVKEIMPVFLTTMSKTSLAEDFLNNVEYLIPQLFNMKPNIDDLVKYDPKVYLTDMSPTDIYNITSKVTKDKRIGPLGTLVNQFEDKYIRLRDQLQKNLVAQIVADVPATASARTEDIQKYIGIDIGAIYARKIDELRQFVTFNVYWGTVDDRPLPSKQGFWQSRLSLTLGASLGDFSGNDDSDIRNDNAYIVGLGFRMNKYFRLSAGNMIYRSISSGDLEEDIYFGISIDLTGFKTISGLVSKPSP